MSLHHWISTGEQEFDTCLFCGGMWRELHPGEVLSEHASFNGEHPPLCTRNTQQCHHYANECPVTDGSECQLDPECNCVFCHS